MIVPSPESAPSTSAQEGTSDPGWGLYTRVRQALFPPVNELEQEACFIEEIRISGKGGVVRFVGGAGPVRQSERLALCSEWPESMVPCLRDRIQRELMVHVAGFVAEDLWSKLLDGGEWPTPGTSVGLCYRLSNQLALSVRPGRLGSDIAGATLAASMLDRLGLTGDHVLEAERRVDDLLRAEWDRVERLAHSLCRRGLQRQTGREVDGLIGPVPEWRPPA